MSIRTEASERWVRGYANGVTVVDTRHPLLVWDDPFPVPHYAYPRIDVRTDLLTPAEPGADHRFFGPHGPVSETFDLIADGRRCPRAAWIHADPTLSEHVFVTWQPGVLDRWTEEDEEVFAHPRDPHKRVDAVRSSRHVQVALDGVVLADTYDPVLLFETGLPTRYYFPPEDVRLDRLEVVDHMTICPYKGTADRYWNAPSLSRLAWSYRAPVAAVAAISGRIAFYNEFVDVTVDGQVLDRPVSPFSMERP